jgi:uncharacterized protein YbjT (DUF2867 family)
MIVVSGASGRVGGEIVRQLVGAGLPVRAMVRHASAAGGLPPGAAAVVADFADPISLDRAFAGAERVFLASWQPGPAEIRLQASAIAAARRAGVGHAVLLSGARADPASAYAVSRWHGLKERQLEESGLAFTHLRPTWFMQNLFGFVADGLIRLPAGSGRAAFIDVADVAAVAVRALTGPGHGSAAYELTGPEALSYRGVAGVLSRVLGRDIGFEDVAPWAFRARLLSAGWDEASADAYLGLFERFRTGLDEAVSDAVERVAGRPPRSLADFAQRNAARFAGP